MSRRARFKISRDKRREETNLGKMTAEAAEFQAKEKKWSKGMGMLGALLAPMAVATTVFSGGAAAPLWASMLAAGAGAAAGAKLGEEVAEAGEKGGIQFGEDKYSGGRDKKGREFRKNLTKGKFTKDEGLAIKDALIDSADRLDSGMLKDAAVASAMMGVKGLGGVKGIKEGIAEGGKLTTKAGRLEAFGFVNKAGEKTGLDYAAKSFAGRTNKTLMDSVKGAFTSGKEGLMEGVTKYNPSAEDLNQMLGTVGEEGVVGAMKVAKAKNTIGNIVQMGTNIFEGIVNPMKSMGAVTKASDVFQQNRVDKYKDEDGMLRGYNSSMSEML